MVVLTSVRPLSESRCNSGAITVTLASPSLEKRVGVVNTDRSWSVLFQRFSFVPTKSLILLIYVKTNIKKTYYKSQTQARLFQCCELYESAIFNYYKLVTNIFRGAVSDNFRGQ